MFGPKVYNVLFLCTHNSSRSIMAEAILQREGKGLFKTFSAGSFPTGKINPAAIKLLKRLGHETEGFRSKSWDEFSAPGAPHLDFVFTVCDDAAGEVCPHWPGQPMTAHWPITDPSMAEGSKADIAMAFFDAYCQLRARITLFTNLPFTSIGRMTLQDRLRDIGRMHDAPERAV